MKRSIIAVMICSGMALTAIASEKKDRVEISDEIIAKDFRTIPLEQPNMLHASQASEQRFYAYHKNWVDVYDIAAGKHLERIEHNRVAQYSCLSPTTERLFVHGFGGKMAVYDRKQDISKPEAWHSLDFGPYKDREWTLSKAEFSADEKKVSCHLYRYDHLAGAKKRMIVRFDLDTGKSLEEKVIPVEHLLKSSEKDIKLDKVSCVQMQGNYKAITSKDILYMAQRDSNQLLWSHIFSQKESRELNDIYSIAFGGEGDEEFIATRTADGIVRFFCTPTGDYLAELDRALFTTCLDAIHAINPHMMIIDDSDEFHVFHNNEVRRLAKLALLAHSDKQKEIVPHNTWFGCVVS